MTENDLSLLEF